MNNPIRTVFQKIADGLAGAGLIDRERGQRTVDLVWPKTVTGLARTSQRTIDFIMLGTLLGPQALAGIGLAQVYLSLGNGFSNALGGGTVNQVSQRFGADAYHRLNLAVKQSLWISLAVASVVTFVFWAFPGVLFSVFDVGEMTLFYGREYLRVLAFVMIPYYANTVWARTLAGADNTRIPMIIRISGAMLNILLNIVFILGLGMGVYGAALGTLLAETSVTVIFALGFLVGGIPLIGDFPVRFDPYPPYFDRKISIQLVKITYPLLLRKSAQKLVRIPFLALLAAFGPTIVAAYEINRRVRNMMSAPGRGFGTAASSLIGQTLGTGDESGAETFGWEILQFSLIIYFITAVGLFLLAMPISKLFVQGPDQITQTAPFIQVAGIALLGFGIEKTTTGTLKGAGDTRWPLYARFIGLYGFMLPLAYLGVMFDFGIPALYVALIAETTIPAIITSYRFWTGKWKVVSRNYRPDVQ